MTTSLKVVGLMCMCLTVGMNCHQPKLGSERSSTCCALLHVQVASWKCSRGLAMQRKPF